MAGNIKRTTANYSFRIPYFDVPGWGREMERNFDTIDAVLYAATNFGGIVGPWLNSTVYVQGQRVVDQSDSTIWECLIDHTSAATGSFADDRAANPTYWLSITQSFNFKGDWTAATNYVINDIIQQDYLFGLVISNFTSTTSLQDDIDDGNAIVMFDGTGTVDDATTAKVAAEAAQSAAAASQSAAATSATNASNSASAAAGSAATATTQATNASNSATAASGSATTASTQATNAANSASAANTSATNAATSETNAADSADLAADIANAVQYMQGFRNKIINGDFLIWQRSTANQTTSGYGSDDRWINGNVGTTKIHSRQSHTVGQTDVPGDPEFFSRTVVTSVANAANFCQKAQKIENVRTLQGKQATVTFYAKADSAKNIAIEFLQHFGTGGSPSADVSAIESQLVALTTAWQKFSITVDIPSIAGKTLGTNNNSYLELFFWFDAGSNFNARAANLGQQSGTFDISHVSVVAGDATAETDPFFGRFYDTELNMCQRYYQWAPLSMAFLPANNGELLQTSTMFTTNMRTKPTTSTSVVEPQATQSNANNAADSCVPQSTYAAAITLQATTGGVNTNVGGYRYLLDAEL
jgi:hypothetical protein